MRPYNDAGNVITALPLLLRRKRRKLGLSRLAASRQLGITPGVVRRIEQGENVSTDKTLAVLRWLDQGQA